MGQWITETLATASPVIAAGSKRGHRRRLGKAPEDNDDDAMDLGPEDRGVMGGKSGEFIAIS